MITVAPINGNTLIYLVSDKDANNSTIYSNTSFYNYTGDILATDLFRLQHNRNYRYLIRYGNFTKYHIYFDYAVLNWDSIIDARNKKYQDDDIYIFLVNIFNEFLCKEGIKVIVHLPAKITISDNIIPHKDISFTTNEDTKFKISKGAYITIKGTYNIDKISYTKGFFCDDRIICHISNPGSRLNATAGLLYQYLLDGDRIVESFKPMDTFSIKRYLVDKEKFTYDIGQSCK